MKRSGLSIKRRKPISAAPIKAGRSTISATSTLASTSGIRQHLRAYHAFDSANQFRFETRPQAAEHHHVDVTDIDGRCDYGSHGLQCFFHNGHGLRIALVPAVDQFVDGAAVAAASLLAIPAALTMERLPAYTSRQPRRPQRQTGPRMSTETWPNSPPKP